MSVKWIPLNWIVFQESVKHGDGQSEGSDLSRQVDGMLVDLKKAHKIREEQLSVAAQDFKRQMEQTQRRHEELLIAYKYDDSIPSLSASFSNSASAYDFYSANS